MFPPLEETVQRTKGSGCVRARTFCSYQKCLCVRRQKCAFGCCIHQLETGMCIR